MRAYPIAIVFACTVLLSAAMSSLVEMRASLLAQSVEQQSSLYQSPAGLGPISLTSAQAEQELARGNSALDVVAARTAAFLHLARVLDTLALTERDPRLKISYLCGSLSALGRALVREPRNARYLINWANIRQLLGGVQCGEPYTAGDFEPVVKLALERDPADTRVLYAAALVYYWSGRAEQSRALLNRMLLLGGGLTAGQERFVYSTIETPRDVERVIPGRFPQAAAWADIFRQIDADRFMEFGAAFGTLEAAAVRASAVEFDRGKIPAEVHQQRLLSLFGAESSEESRVALDLELSRFAASHRQLALASYLDERAKLHELKVLRASLDGDTRPLRTSLSGWERDERVVFDEFYRTVGFYVPEGQEVVLIQLASTRNNGGAVPSRNDLRVMASSDNENWSDLSDELEVSGFQVALPPLVVLRPKRASYKYWKVQFSSPERRRTFTNSLSGLVRVFGMSRFAGEEHS